MSNDMGGYIVFLILVASSVVGMLLPAPRQKKSTDELLAEIVRRMGRKL